MHLTMDEAQLEEAVTDYLRKYGIPTPPQSIRFVAGRGPNSGHRAEIELRRPDQPIPAEAPEPVKATPPAAKPAPATKSTLTKEQQEALERARQMAEEDRREAEAEQPPFDPDPPKEEPTGKLQAPVPAFDEPAPLVEPEPTKAEVHMAKLFAPNTFGAELFGEKVEGAPKRQLFPKKEST